MKKTGLLLMIFMSMFLIISCDSKDDDIDNLTAGAVKKYEFLNATSYTDWVYFSFDKNTIVEVSDFKNDLSWDIAFHRGDIRLNGGMSGAGNAEAINTGLTDWNSVTVAPDSGYKTDENGVITIAFTGTGINSEEQPFSQVLADWITIDTSNPPPVYTYHNWVYVVKSATGKYVKLQIYDYKNEKNSTAYISFKYQYNEDGSSKF